MRFFIALEIPDQNKKELGDIQNQIKSVVPSIKPTDSAKFHLTIAFIGEQPDEVRFILEEAITKSVVGISPFRVTPGYIDGFPTLHNPRILWAGVKGDIDKLVILRERIKDALVSLNLPIDARRYEPHIALAKIKNFKLERKQEEVFQKMMMKEFEPIQVSSIKLFQSIPNHGFHNHNTLAEIKLI